MQAPVRLTCSCPDLPALAGKLRQSRSSIVVQARQQQKPEEQRQNGKHKSKGSGLGDILGPIGLTLGGELKSEVND